MNTELAPLLAAASLPMLLLAALAVFRWRYVRLIERTIHASVPTLETPFESTRPAANVRSIRFEWDVSPDADSDAALAAAVQESEATRRAFTIASIVYLIGAAAVVWWGQAAIVQPRAATALAYFSTLSSGFLALAFARPRARWWLAAALVWLASGYFLLVGPLRVPWIAAFAVMVTGVTYGSYALLCVALLVLRAGRTLLIGVVPAVGLWLLLSTAVGLVIQAFGIDVFDAFTLRAAVFGLGAVVLGTALAVREIRRSAVLRLFGLLTALLVVSQVAARWRAFEFPAAIMTGIAFNGLVTVLIWWAFQTLLRLKSRGHLPDQVLHLLFCWLVLTAFVGLSAGIEQQSLYVVGVPAVASTSTLIVFLLRTVVARGGVTTPKRMLLLRVFAQATARRRLLDVLDDSWRRVGGIDTVVGVDLALRTMNALALQDFLLGRMGRQMVTSTADLTDRLARFAYRRALDGRYPVNEFLCLPHVWQETVATLAHAADVVLMDLRGYTPQHRGSTFELSLVVERVPVARVVVLIDDSTDIDAFSAVVESAWARLPANSPNYGVRDPSMSVVRCSRWLADADAIVSRVFAAAYGRVSAGAGVVVGAAHRPATRTFLP